MTIKYLLADALFLRLMLITTFLALAITNWQRSDSAVVWVIFALINVPLFLWHAYEFGLRLIYGSKNG